MKIFIKEASRGRQILGENKIIYNFFLDFYEKEYKSLYDGEKIDGKNLSGILHYIQTEIVTAIENNVKIHFNDYINRFVNSSFKNEHSILLEKLKGKERDKLKKKLQNELKMVKNDLMNLTNTRDPKYNEWFYDWKHKILPILDFNIKLNMDPTLDLDCEIDSKYTTNYYCYLKSNPQEFLICMKRMSAEINRLGFKTFQYFPLRTNITPKYIPLDSKSIIDLFMDNKTKYFSDIDKYKEEIWNTIIDLDNKVFFQKYYEFDYKISTDGYTVSLQFIHKKSISKRNIKKGNLKKGQNNARKEYKNLERKKIEEMKREKQEKNENYKKEKIEKAHERKEKFKKLTKKEKEEIKLKNQVEFPYLEELTESQIENLIEKRKKGKVCYLDGGKIRPIKMKNDKDKYFTY